MDTTTFEVQLRLEARRGGIDTADVKQQDAENPHQSGNHHAHQF